MPLCSSTTGGGLEEPLDWKNIQSIDDIRVYDRSVVTPDIESMFSYSPDDPFRTRGSRLGEPEYYHVYSKYGSFLVHESRCLVFKNGRLPEKCTNSIYELWGMPEYIRLKRAIRDTEIAHGDGPKMLDKAVQAVYKMRNLSEELAAEGGEDRVLKRLEVIDLARGLMDSIAIDAEGEDYDFRQFSFTGVSEIIDTTCNMLSALSSIPQTILFGRSPAGMNATGTSDLENWYGFVERIQKRMVKNNLRYLLSVIFQAGVATGEIEEVPNIKIDFRPLWSLSDTEQANLEQVKAAVQQTKASTTQIYVGMGAIDPSEVRVKLAEEGEYNVENILDDLTEEELFANMNQPDQGAIPGMEGGNSPDAAPAATKLPQDMTGEELEEQSGQPDVSQPAAITGSQAVQTVENKAKGEEGTLSSQSEEAEQKRAKQKKVEETDNIDEEENLEPIYETPEHMSVGVIIVSNGRILNATRNNDTKHGQICGPGGHIEEGETAEQAAIRETQEEFGITPSKLVKLGYGPMERDTGLSPVVFLCTNYTGRVKCDEVEMIYPRFNTLKELEMMDAWLYKPFKYGIELMKHEIGIAPDDSEANFDAEDKDIQWITVNGTHIPLKDSTAVGGPLEGKDFSEAKSQSETKESTTKSTFNKRLHEERRSVLGGDISDQALFLCDEGVLDYDDAVEAMDNGSATQKVEEYFEILEENGDTTSTKPLADNDNPIRKMVNSGEYDDYQTARVAHIEKITGANHEDAVKMEKALQEWTGFGYQNADTAQIDKFVEQSNTYKKDIYRGLHFEKGGFDEFVNACEPGAVIGGNGRNTSWASNYEDALRFSHKEQDDIDSVVIICKKNRTSAPIAFANWQGESEVVAHSKAQWTVVGKKVSDKAEGGRHAVITVIEKGEYQSGKRADSYRRLDADSDGQNRGGGDETESKGSGGNTALPYGLCKKYGIDLPKGATPKQAWEALKEKTGISADKAYSELEKSGTAQSITPTNSSENNAETSLSATGQESGGSAQSAQSVGQNAPTAAPKPEKPSMKDVEKQASDKVKEFQADYQSNIEKFLNDEINLFELGILSEDILSEAEDLEDAYFDIYDETGEESAACEKALDELKKMSVEYEDMVNCAYNVEDTVNSFKLSLKVVSALGSKAKKLEQTISKLKALQECNTSPILKKKYQKAVEECEKLFAPVQKKLDENAAHATSATKKINHKKEILDFINKSYVATEKADPDTGEIINTTKEAAKKSPIGQVAINGAQDKVYVKAADGMWVDTEDYSEHGDDFITYENGIYLLSKETKDAYLQKELSEIEQETAKIQSSSDYDEDTSAKMQKAYAEYRAELFKAQKGNKQKVSTSSHGVEGFSSDAYSAERKNAAVWCQSKYESVATFEYQAKRAYLDSTKEERYAAWDYTTGSGRFNRPLRGYESPLGTNGKENGWADEYFVGERNADPNYEGVGVEMDSLTDFLGRNEFDEDVWMQHGYDNVKGFLSFLGINEVTEKTLQHVLDSQKELHDAGFLSCGGAKGTGFADCNWTLNIYAPKGTKGVYIAPDSHYGGADGKYDGTQKAYAGKENEILLQRDSYFRMTKFEHVGSHWYVDVEVVAQKPYDYSAAKKN